jgi:hypothetical protein
VMYVTRKGDRTWVPLATGHKNPDFSGCLMPHFNDWKHFCLVLREIASDLDGRPLSGNEAQQRAREALTSAGYRWWGCQPEALETIEPPLRGKRRRRA